MASVEYASESEVARKGLLALAARDRAVESWLRDQMVPAYDRLAIASTAMSPCQVRVHVAEPTDR